MKKILFISNHAGFSKFNAPYMKWFHDHGWIVHNASPGIETGYYDAQFDLPIERNPLSSNNLVALQKLRRICRENQYDIVHCHTPVGGALGRLSVRKRCKTKVIYTAHGFHFYKGSSFLSWLIYFPIEKILATRTDCIVTINEEDFLLAKKHFHTNVKKLDGVGVDLSRFAPITESARVATRHIEGLEEDDFVLIYVAQFIERKNHLFLINKVDNLLDRIPNLKICLVGSGPNLEDLIKLCHKKGLSNVVRFMGYRRDVDKLYPIADLLISVSKQEGLPINIVEGMACGLPFVCSDIRGHRDIFARAPGNFLFEFDDDSFEKQVIYFYKNREILKKVGLANVRNAQIFSLENAIRNMAKIYQEVLGSL